MTSRHPLIERADGIEQFRGDRLAIVQRQQQSGQEQPAVGAAFTATDTDTDTDKKSKPP